MPVTTLNRTIATFIVGGAPLVWWLLRNPDAIMAFAQSREESGTLLNVLIVFALIPVTAIMGMIAESVADLGRYWLIKPTLRKRALAGFFFHATEFDELQRWIAAVEGLGLKAPGGTSMTSFTAGYFLAHASKEQVDWVDGRYSSHSLASSLACILPVLGALDIACYGGCFGWPIVLEAAAILAATYFMLSFAIDMFLYSYNMSARFAFMHLTRGDLSSADNPASASPLR